MRESAPVVRALLVITLLAGTLACGGSTPPPTAGTCRGQGEHLTFAGDLAGDFACQGSRVKCTATAFGKGINAHLVGDVGRRGIVMDITVGGTPGHDYHGAGSYETGPGSSEPAAAVRVTAGGGGGGDWRSDAGGPVVVTATAAGTVAGSLDLQLPGYGGGSEHVSGTWTCDS